MGYIPWQEIRLDPWPPGDRSRPRPSTSPRGPPTGPKGALRSDLRDPPVGPESPRDEIVGWVRELRALRRCFKDDEEAVGWIDEAMAEVEGWVDR